MRRQQGQLLVEAILALGIATVIITGIVIAVVSSLNNSNFVKNQNLASNYAQEGLDVIRDLKDTDYGSFSTLQGYYCLEENENIVDASMKVDDPSFCEENITGVFGRTVFISQTGADTRGGGSAPACSIGRAAVFVASTVVWTDTKCRNGDACHRVDLSSCFTDLNQIPEP